MDDARLKLLLEQWLQSLRERADKQTAGEMTRAEWVAQANDEHALARYDAELEALLAPQADDQSSRQAVERKAGHGK